VHEKGQTCSTCGGMCSHISGRCYKCRTKENAPVMASRGAREGGRAHLLLAQWRRASRQLVTSGGAFGAYFLY